MIKRFYQRLKGNVTQLLRAAKKVNYAAVLSAIPGLTAWAFEILCMATAGLLVLQAAQAILARQILLGFALVILSAMMIGLCLLSSRYTEPPQNNQGGGG